MSSAAKIRQIIISWLPDYSGPLTEQTKDDIAGTILKELEDLGLAQSQHAEIKAENEELKKQLSAQIDSLLAQNTRYREALEGMRFLSTAHQCWDAARQALKGGEDG